MLVSKNRPITECDAVDRRVLETQRTSVAADLDITLGHWRIYPYYLSQTVPLLEPLNHTQTKGYFYPVASWNSLAADSASAEAGRVTNKSANYLQNAP